MDKVINNNVIKSYLQRLNFKNYDVDEGRLMLLELISKAGAGYYNSHTEEAFLNSFGLLKKDRTPNKQGLKIIMSMVYEHSNQRPLAYKFMQTYRV